MCGWSCMRRTWSEPCAQILESFAAGVVQAAATCDGASNTDVSAAVFCDEAAAAVGRRTARGRIVGSGFRRTNYARAASDTVSERRDASVVVASRVARRRRWGPGSLQVVLGEESRRRYGAHKNGSTRRRRRQIQTSQEVPSLTRRRRLETVFATARKSFQRRRRGREGPRSSQAEGTSERFA